MTSRKRNKRFARKNAVRWNSDIKEDSMSAARRHYGLGYAR